MRLLSKIRGWKKPPAVNRNSGVAILAGGMNASIAYLIEPFLAARGQSATCIDTNNAPPQHFDHFGFSAVVIVRYLPRQWKKSLRDFRSKGGSMIYFMDDDLMDPAILVGLPSAYAKKIRAQAVRQRAVLEALCTEFWVSSPYLAEKYRDWKPELLTLQPAMANLLPVSAITVCYHGTSSHSAEIEWLAPIIAAVQMGKPDTRFEVFGDHSVNKMYRDISGVAILHPMSWPNYLAYTSSVQRDIALAPLLPHPFNAGRGPTKFFDFVRMGAVGIYTNIEPYRGFIRDGVDGLLLENDPDLWVRTIIMLAGDESLRHRMAESARQRAFEMAALHN